METSYIRLRYEAEMERVSALGFLKGIREYGAQHGFVSNSGNIISSKDQPSTSCVDLSVGKSNIGIFLKKRRARTDTIKIGMVVLLDKSNPHSQQKLEQLLQNHPMFKPC